MQKNLTWFLILEECSNMFKISWANLIKDKSIPFMLKVVPKYLELII